MRRRAMLRNMMRMIGDDGDDGGDDDDDEEEEEDMVGLCRINPCEHKTDRTREESIPQKPPLPSKKIDASTV